MASKEKPTRKGKKNEGDPLAELESVLNGAAKKPDVDFEKTIKTGRPTAPVESTTNPVLEQVLVPTTEPMPEVLQIRKGQLADGATWEMDDAGEIVIKRMQKYGMMGDKTREVAYTSTMREGKEILNQIERGVATSEPIAQTIVPVPEVPLEVREHKAKEQKKIDARIKASRAEGTEEGVIDYDLSELEGIDVPPRGLQMYKSLKDPKTKEAVRASWIADKEREERKKALQEEQEKQKAATTPKAHAAAKSDKRKEPKPKLKGESTEVESPQVKKKIDTVEKERKPISLDEVENFVREKLGSEAEITKLGITETPEGLQIQAILQHGMAGEINLKGTIVNHANTIGVQGLKVTAKRFEKKVKSKIEDSLSGIGAAFKTHFEKQYGKTISNIQVGESGLAVEFESSVAADAVIGESDGRIEPKFKPDKEVTEDFSPKSDATPAERRSKFFEVMKKVGDVFGNVSEAVSERFTKSKNYLDGRAKQLDSQAQTSKAENIVRKMGEMYNKLNWREKLGIGLVLGASAVVTGGASIYLPYVFTGLIGTQRAFGMASMYLSQEKALLSAKVNESNQFISAKERASIDAVMSGALMGAAIGKGIQLANEYELVERTREWLGGVLGHNVAPVHEDVTRMATGKITMPEAHQPAAAAAAHEAVRTGAALEPQQPLSTAEVPAAVSDAGEVAPDADTVPDFKLDNPMVAPEMPVIDVPASTHGYEGMMKDLLKQLPDTKPENIPGGSDLAKLYEARANPGLLEKTMYELAKGHKFLVDGESVRIDPTAHMTIVDGQLHLIDVAHPDGMFDAASDMHVLHPHATAPSVEAAVAVDKSPANIGLGEPSELPAAGSTQDQDLATQQGAAVEHAAPAAPAGAEQNLAPVEEAFIKPVPPHSISDNIWRDSESNPITTGDGNPVTAGFEPQPKSVEPSPLEKVDMDTVAPEAIPTVEAPVYPLETAPLPPEGVISNQFGLAIPAAEPHIYMDPEGHPLAYGGSSAEKMNAILDYLTKNPDKTVFGADPSGKYRIPWHLVDGKVTPAGLPVRTSGFFGFFSSFMNAPEPDELEKLIQ